MNNLYTDMGFNNLYTDMGFNNLYTDMGFNNLYTYTGFNNLYTDMGWPTFSAFGLSSRKRGLTNTREYDTALTW